MFLRDICKSTYQWFCKISNQKSGVFFPGTNNNDDVGERGRHSRKINSSGVELTLKVGLVPMETTLYGELNFGIQISKNLNF